MPNNRQEITAIPEDPGNIERLQDVIDSIAASQNGFLSEESANLFLRRLDEEGDALLQNITDVPIETSEDANPPFNPSLLRDYRYRIDINNSITPSVIDGYLYEAAPVPDEVAARISNDFWEAGFRRREELRRQRNEETAPCVHTWAADTVVIQGDEINIGQEGNKITIAGKDFRKLCDDLNTIIKALDLEENKEVSIETISKVKQKIKNSEVRRITIMKEKI